MRSSRVSKVQKRRSKHERLEPRIPCAQEAATKTIKDFEMLSLCDEARAVFVKALVTPPAPNRNLRLAADRYRKYVRA